MNHEVHDGHVVALKNNIIIMKTALLTNFHPSISFILHLMEWHLIQESERMLATEISMVHCLTFVKFLVSVV
jgi:hypothetical protein